ncbi:MAG: endonuclease MutS2 [Flavobacteriales bacterium]
MKPGAHIDHFDERVAEDLEFDVIRELLRELAGCESSEKRASTLTPSKDRTWVIRTLQETDEMQRIRSGGTGWPMLEFDELKREIKLLGVRDSVLDETGFRRISTASRIMNQVLAVLAESDMPWPRLEAVVEGQEPSTELIEAIDAVFDAKGHIRDNASPELEAIRADLTAVRRKINRSFLRAMKHVQDRGFLADIREGFVQERRALAVLSSYKRQVNGAVLGSSNTGSVTFIEPGTCIPLNHELEMLKDDERKEIRNILRVLTRNIRRHLPQIKGYQRGLTELDWIATRARLASKLEGSLPQIRKKPGLHLLSAYHPLLQMTNRLAGKETYPQHVELHRKQRMLVISGPNAGGKSITMKTVGLLQMMIQSGLLVPCHNASEVGIFDSILPDIGDHQSIENQLSTYSYRLGRMKHFLGVSGPRSLLLLDEFGTGSDPELGGALAEVFFEELYDKGCFGVVTTHYANIKTRAAKLPEAFNGSMLFNRESLAPMYQLEVGQPGSSFTFEVAEINGIASALIERAKGKLDKRRVELDGLLGDLHKEKSKLAKLTNRQLRAELEAEKAMAEAERLQSALEDKERNLNDQFDQLNTARVRGTKLSQFVDRFESGKANKALLEEVKTYLAKEKAKAENPSKKAKAKAAKRRPNHQSDKIVVGSLVRLRTGQERGDVVAVQGDHVTVMFGAFKTRVKRNQLTWLR